MTKLSQYRIRPPRERTVSIDGGVEVLGRGRVRFGAFGRLSRAERRSLLRHLPQASWRARLVALRGLVDETERVATTWFAMMVPDEEALLSRPVSAALSACHKALTLIAELEQPGRKAVSPAMELILKDWNWTHEPKFAIALAMLDHLRPPLLPGAKTGDERIVVAVDQLLESWYHNTGKKPGLGTTRLGSPYTFYEELLPVLRIMKPRGLIDPEPPLVDATAVDEFWDRCELFIVKRADVWVSPEGN